MIFVSFVVKFPTSPRCVFANKGRLYLLRREHPVKTRSAVSVPPSLSLAIGAYGVDIERRYINVFALSRFNNKRVALFAVIVGVSLRINGTTSVNTFFYMGTIGVLSMLVAYIVVNLGAMRFLHLGRREAVWRVIVPILAIAALVYVIYKNVWPRPAYPYDNFPLMVGGWLLLFIIFLVWLLPQQAARESH